jgi:heme/copper-type cytochrome/quinol oxidase subunit 2
MPESNLKPPPGRLGSLVAWVLILAASVFTVLGAFLYERHLAADRRAIDIVAQAPEKGNFVPRLIPVAGGERIRLRVRNIDTVSHGFALPQLNVGVPEIKPGEVALLEFIVPEGATEYEFTCTVWCSNDHMTMKGKLVVAPTLAHRR